MRGFKPTDSPRILVLRLSSLGDLVLATAALSALPIGAQVDWVVEKRFQELLQGHPRIRRVIAFDRASGARGWWELVRALSNNDYDEVWDLHRTLRTVLARFSPLRRFRWRAISKERVRTWGLCVFRKLWPTSWHPTPWVKRFSNIGDPTAGAHPDFSHWRKSGDRSSVLAVMPSSAWPGKEWTIDGFVEALRALKRPIVLLGREEDEASRALRAAFSKQGIAFDDQVGRMNLRETGELLSQAHAYFGVDTGLAHLAEAVGTPAWVLMGPTSPLSGFGPWRPESLAIGLDLFCRPCGKDGTACIRPIRRHLCLKGLPAAAVLDQIGKGP